MDREVSLWQGFQGNIARFSEKHDFRHLKDAIFRVLKVCVDFYGGIAFII